MYCEYPVREHHARVFVNRPVGVILLDGTRHHGIIVSCENGRLMLKPFKQEANEVDVESIRKRRITKPGSVKTKARRKKSTTTKALFPPPYPYPPAPVFGPPIALELATIALLFALLP